MAKTTQEGKSRQRTAAAQVSMAEVARHAGVSSITVSRALHHPDKVTAKTREAVDRAINELGYVPNLVAGSLASTRTRIISVIVPYITHGVFADALQGAADILEEAHFCVLLGNSQGAAEREESIVRTLLGHRPAGVILQGANHTAATRRLLSKARVPVVEMGTLPAEPIDMAVGYSNRAASREMTRRLLASGHRRIGFVCVPPERNDRAAERLAGYREALAEAGVAFDPALVRHAPFSIEEGREALGVFLALAEPPDAVFCTSDLWAYGMIAEATRRGIEVPRDLAVAGFNDQSMAAESVPGITTIRVPRYEIGRRAGEQILARLAGEPTARIVDLGYELVARDSA
ncbi:LacI family DNA-binding transcriptional regulator [Acuticoccus sp. M5D2P5]|uniref:LacI family DNA-binding transcriptional regulator n=1 Tax=Acuticoccus kalidii TaxID=2910977 RepID=UPI001F3565C6|nr:LacI family DNA-binding transcriptional regulator [Acuticoccus kalidii]MCF3933433.1 LacI family DNA-binding transcriptional regulator [Acuticoccus kalidii]